METNKDLKVVSTLWGEETISLRDDKIAGQVAKEEGDKFEDYAEKKLHFQFLFWFSKMLNFDTKKAKFYIL